MSTQHSNWLPPGSSTQPSHSGEIIISTGFRRVGCEPLRPLPLQTVVDHRCSLFLRKYGNQIDEIVYDTLRRQHFPVVDDFVDARDAHDADKLRWKIRSRVGQDSLSYVTILITLPWDPANLEKWQQTCRRLKNRTDVALRNSGYNVLVEMHSPQLDLLMRCGPVRNRPDLDHDWVEIRDKVCVILDYHKSTLAAWNCIGLLRIGPDETNERNPATLFISMSRESNERAWRPAVEDIEQYLADSGHGLQLHMQHSAPQGQNRSKFELRNPDNKVKHTDPLLTKFPYEARLSMGADLSASTYVVAEPVAASAPDPYVAPFPPPFQQFTPAHQSQTPPAQASSSQAPLAPEMVQFNSAVGTLGCYIEIVDQAGNWKPYALTNYHVVRCAIPGFRMNTDKKILPPLPGTALRHADIHGFRPDHDYTINMESPSREKHNKNIWYYTNFTDPSEDEQQFHKQRVKENLAFFDSGKHILGRLYAGSGFTYRTSENGVLDWALIEVLPSRLGNNNLPDRKFWPTELLDFRPPEQLSKAPLKERPTPVREIFQMKHAYKFSAVTKATSGVFSRHAFSVNVDQWSYLVRENMGSKTTEYCFINSVLGQGLNFSDHGDSGAVVYDNNARAIGLLFRGQATVTGGGAVRDLFTYVTPFEYVLAHITEFLGLKASAVRIAQFQGQ